MMSQRGKRESLARLLTLGFDRSRMGNIGVSVRCSQCEALVINGHPSHEQYCPNRVPVCKECGNLDPDGTCCQWDEDAAVAAEEQRIEDGQARWSETGSTRKS